MLNEKVAALLNDQINKEFYSAYLYLDFSNYFEARGLDGFANWYRIQAQEERDHAMLFYQRQGDPGCHRQARQGAGQRHGRTEGRSGA